ncbi:hypothetical protein ACFWIQ_14115 [Kitasatospora sp. NPDC127059]|uniref:hypothetical protein n=1 Tax=Kitasatospora sp. NPDC127059 TaxID=3347120 RepID=UPI003661769E
MGVGGPAQPAHAQVHQCGPVPFMCAVRARFRQAGVPGDLIRHEVFGPDLWLPGTADA